VSYEVSEPILNSPYEEPKQYWYIRKGETPSGQGTEMTAVSGKAGGAKRVDCNQ
jgi:hypothetical protein